MLYPSWPQLSSASLEVVLSVAIASFTVEMSSLPPIFDAKKAIYGKNLHPLYLGHFSTELAQIFTSLLTFKTD